MDRNSYEFKIDGNSYVLKTNRSEEEAEKIVAYVDKQIDKAKKTVKYKNKAAYTALACLNIADDLYDIDQELEKLKEDTAEAMENYEPLKAEYHAYKENHKEADILIMNLKEKIFDLEKDLERVSLERDNYKLELDRQKNLADKSIEETTDLRNKLLEEEKKTLMANKKLEELLKNRTGN